MKVTGYQLIDTIERLREQAQTINSQFTSSLHRFPDGAEAKPDPRDLMERYLATEKRVAALQAAQATYNTQITVEVLGEPMSLQQAIKLIGRATVSNLQTYSHILPRTMTASRCCRPDCRDS